MEPARTALWAAAVIGRLAQLCGTLLTPMVAKFNVAPVRLLGLGSEWAVVRAQARRW